MGTIAGALAAALAIMPLARAGGGMSSSPFFSSDGEWIGSNPGLLAFAPLI
jgi:hypothetical protein